MDDDKYLVHRMELLLDELKAIHELVAEVPRMARKLDGVADDMAQLKQDVQVIRAVAEDVSRDLDKHKTCLRMWRMGMRDSSKCAECECDLLAFAKNSTVPGFAAAIQFVRRTTGRQVFICWRCADERYKARQMKVC